MTTKRRTNAPAAEPTPAAAGDDLPVGATHYLLNQLLEWERTGGVSPQELTKAWKEWWELEQRRRQWEERREERERDARKAGGQS
jgi:hypothetical protein